MNSKPESSFYKKIPFSKYRSFFDFLVKDFGRFSDDDELIVLSSR
jgi:hypothetical protein